MESLSGTCRLTMSDRSRSTSSVGTKPARPVSWRVVWITSMSNPAARWATARAIRPNPTSPSVAPWTSRARCVPKPHPVHRPSRRSRSASLASRVAVRIRRKARSAVVSSSTPGVLQTVMPIVVAETTSMLSYPTAALATTRSRPLRPDSRTAASMRSVRWQTIPSHSAAARASSSGERRIPSSRSTISWPASIRGSVPPSVKGRVTRTRAT